MTFAVVGTNLVTYAVMLVILLILCFVFLPGSRGTEWLALPLAALFVCFVCGLVLTLASLNVLFRDVEHLVGALLLPWFFLTPVIYSFTQFHHQTISKVIRYMNPVTPQLEAIRAPLWAGTMPAGGDVLYLVAAAVVALTVGALVFRRIDDRIAVEL